MDKYEIKILEAELAKGLPCVLKHEDTGERPAITYIIQEIGYTGQKLYDVTIPICQDCVDGLASSEWILLYCLRCTHNQWVYKPLGRLNYKDKNICWMSCCPECKEHDERADVFWTD